MNPHEAGLQVTHQIPSSSETPAVSQLITAEKWHRPPGMTDKQLLELVDRSCGRCEALWNFVRATLKKRDPQDNRTVTAICSLGETLAAMIAKDPDTYSPDHGVRCNIIESDQLESV